MPHRLRCFWQISLAGLVYLIWHVIIPVLFVLTRQGSSSHTTCVRTCVTVEVTLTKVRHHILISDVRAPLQLLLHVVLVLCESLTKPSLSCFATPLENYTHHCEISEFVSSIYQCRHILLCRRICILKNRVIYFRINEVLIHLRYLYFL
jgi:hypothetical protein